MKRLAAAFLVALLCACAAIKPHGRDLADRMDCLREHDLAVVAAHRGQPDQSAAENALSSFRSSLAAGVPFLEIDIATTKDGELALMHDDTLDRTTTGTGKVGDHTWAEIREVRVKTPAGKVLDERVPRLADALNWGREAGARFELDVKPTTRFSDVINAVRAARMRDRVLVVTYKLEDAELVHRLDPKVMISVTVTKPDDIAAARTRIDPHWLLAFTGTRDPQSQPFSTIRAAGIEPIFGTLGRPGQRLDDLYIADGNPSEYRDLVKAGVVMIASDAAVVAQRAIGPGWQACFR